MKDCSIDRLRRCLALVASVAGLQVLIPALAGVTQPVPAAPFSRRAANATAPQLLAAGANDPDFEQQVLRVIRRNPAVLIEALNTYESELQAAKLRAQSEQLRRLYPRPNDLIGNSPRQGAGKVVFVEYSDFQCPYCASAHKAIQQFLQRQGRDVTFVYKHFPLRQIHPQALPAARAAWAAGQQGQFWAYHDALFANQARLGEPLYAEIATNLKLNLSRFNQDRKSSASLQAIQTDVDQAEQLGLSGTPTLIMNQRFLMGPITVEELEKQLSQLRTDKTNQSSLQGTQRDVLEVIPTTNQ
jgi:protein-disulfide isomerase